MTGQIIERASNNAPTGHLPCDGAAVSRTTYSGLFSEIGSAYGNGDGSTTFNVPDLRGRSPLGVGTGGGLSSRSLGDIGGNETHTLVTAELPVHNHGAKCLSTNANAKNPTGLYPAQTQGTSTNNYKSTNDGFMASDFIDNAGSGNAHDIMNPFAVVAYFIEF